MARWFLGRKSCLLPDDCSVTPILFLLFSSPGYITRASDDDEALAAVPDIGVRFGNLWAKSLLRSGRGAGGTLEELEGRLSTSTSIGTSVGV